jgi:hypothetical protein
MQLEDVFVRLYSLLCKYLALSDVVRVCSVNKYLASHCRSSVVQSREFRGVFGRAATGSPAQLRLYYVYRDLLLGLYDDEWSGYADALKHVVQLLQQAPKHPSSTSLPQTVMQYRSWQGMLHLYLLECRRHASSQRLLARLQACQAAVQHWTVSRRTREHTAVAFAQLWKIEAQRVLPVHCPDYRCGPPCSENNPQDSLCPDCVVRQKYWRSALAYHKFKPVLYHHLAGAVG